MPRLIDAEKLAEYKASGISDLTEWQKGWNDAIDTIMGETPSVDAVRHGRWRYIENYMDTYRTIYECSECGSLSNRKDNYCWNCGAKMDEVEDG